MVSYAIAEARANFSELIQIAQKEPVLITTGKSKKATAVVISIEDWKLEKKPKKRIAGSLSHFQVTFSDDWKMTNEDLLGAPAGALTISETP
jgi:prevent-host-death family protein